MFITVSCSALYLCVVCAGVGKLCILDIVDAVDSGLLDRCTVVTDIELLKHA